MEKFVTMTKEQIKEIIPHREPILLIDKVLELETEKRIVTEYYISPDLPIFEGHFPKNPILPGVYAVESMAQSADILLLSMERYEGKTPYFIGIDKVRFKKKIYPNDTLRIEAVLFEENPEKSIASCSVEVFSANGLCTTGVVTLAMR